MRNPNHKCSVCGKLIYRRPSVKEKFSSSYCAEHRSDANKEAAIVRNTKKYADYIKRWKKGLENGMRGKTALSRHIKRYLLLRAKESCEKCGWSEKNLFTNNVPLEVNHIDGNYKNNIESNLEVLCPNCHSLTKYYKGANKGRGRPRK